MVQIDIDMPKQCGECPLCVDYDCIIHKRVTDEYYDTLEEQYAHCPLTMPSAHPEILACGEGELNVPDTNVGDTISRQAAIEAIDLYYKDKRYITRSRTILSAICRDMKSTMDSLPSAQPEPIKINIDDFNKEDWERLKKEWGNTPITVLPAQPEIIRCKDCQYQSKGQNECETWNLCGYRPWQYTPTTDEHFCGYAERREE